MPPPTPSLFPYTTLFRSLPGEVDMMAGGVIIALLEEVAALLEMRVHKSRHQFVMPLCRLPIAPVLRQLAEHAKAARPGDQPLDIGDRVVGCTDAPGAGLDQPLGRVGHIGGD